jgi:hypothetical protein
VHLDTYVHATFLLLLGWVVLEHYLAHGDVVEAIAGVGFILLLFGIVALHELGHAPAALGQHGPETRVGEVMRRDFISADPREMLQIAFARLQSCGCHTLPVVQGDHLLGPVTADHLAEVLMIQEALREARRRDTGEDGRARKTLPVRLTDAALPNRQSNVPTGAKARLM